MAKVEDVAKILFKARGCDRPGSVLTMTEFPCPFCYWTEDAQEESGCMFWAEKIMEVINAT